MRLTEHGHADAARRTAAYLDNRASCRAVACQVDPYSGLAIANQSSEAPFNTLSGRRKGQASKAPLRDG